MTIDRDDCLPTRIAEGWSSDVYVGCRHRPDGSQFPVVIKRLKRQVVDQDPRTSRPHLIEALDREALALATCDHPSLPRFVERVQIDDDPVLVMHALPGQTAGHLVDKQGPLTWRLARWIALRLLDALAHVHAMGWIHCDLNPGNVLVTPAEVFLVDFGAAQRIGVPPRWQWPLGRHRFMPPEHLLGWDERPRFARLGPAGDQHQLACLLIFLLTGEEPYRRPLADEDYLTDYVRNLGRWMAKPITAKMRSLAVECRRQDLPRGLDAVLAQALEPQPEQRYASAAAMRAAISALGG